MKFSLFTLCFRLLGSSLLLILVSIFCFGIGPIWAQDNFFWDTPPDHPYFSALSFLQDQGVLNGYADGSFRPDEFINRAETLKVLLGGSDIVLSSTIRRDPFPDVKKTQWYAPYVDAAKTKGIVRGTQSGEFEPIRTVSQAEALKMLLEVKEIPVDTPLSNPYDNVAADQWYAPYYAEARKRLLVFSSEVDPSKTLTRGELAQLMYRYLDGVLSYDYPIGGASYYGDSFTGKNTASGKEFDNQGYMAAHRFLPFGTKVLVRDLVNGFAVVVEVVDRGPYIPFRNLDLSKTAFAVLENPSRGLTKVELQVVSDQTPLGPVEKICPLAEIRQTIAQNAFEGITLDDDIPTLFRKNEIFALAGKAPGASEVTAFWGTPEKKKRVSVPVQNGRFVVALPFLEVGNFDLGILPGKSGSSRTYPIQVQEGMCLVGTGETPDAVQNLQAEIRNGDYLLQWDYPEKKNMLFRVLFTQGKKSQEFFVMGTNQFFPPPRSFADFESGSAQVRVFAAATDSVFSADVSSPFSASQKLDIVLSQHYFFAEDEERLESHNFAETFESGSQTVFSGKYSGKIQENAILITPTGGVEQVLLQLRDANTFAFDFTPQMVGTYIVEINADTGIAILNAPLYHKDFAPLLPDYEDLNPPEEMIPMESLEVKRRSIDLIRLINLVRQEHNLAPVRPDLGLTELAQFRADDMDERDYFGHTSPDGKGVQDFTIEFGVFGAVSENIARDFTIESAHEGLMRSPLHYQNILNPHWTRVGIGLKLSDSGGLLVVELFSEEPLNNTALDDYEADIFEAVNEQRQEVLDTDPSLQEVAQDWAEKMVQEQFFGGTSPEGQELKKLLQKEGISGNVLIFLYQYASLADFIEQVVLSGHTEAFAEQKWAHLGVGTFVDSLGILNIVLLLGE